jgi:hypothetical protein
MKVAINCMVKNESTILQRVLPIWKSYEIDYYIFYNDKSTDNTVEIIKSFLPTEKIIILNDNLPSFNEGYQRQRMIDESLDKGIDYIITLDADELLTTTITKDLKTFLNVYEETDMLLFWYNCVNNGIEEYRTDPLYSNNYRSFVLPTKNINRLDTSQWQYHTPRTPSVTLPNKYFTDHFGVLHLQSVNRKFYAIKQLWYKHFEFNEYQHTIDFINNRYDPVVNNLNFHPKKIKKELIEGININLDFFEGLEKEKGYLDYIKINKNEELITFGKEYFL